MTFKQTMASLFSTAEGTYYKWKKEQRPIINLLEKYFVQEELEEFLETKKINKYDNLLNIQDIVIKYNSVKYISTFTNQVTLNDLSNKIFIDFYFSLLVDILISKEDKNFTHTINGYLISYVLSNGEQSKTISKYMYMFKSWDDLMAVYLKIELTNDFSSLLLYEHKNQETINEAVYHIVGLYIYKNYSSFSTNIKFDLVQKLYKRFERVLGIGLSYDQVISFIKKKEKEIFNEIKDIHGII